MVRHRTEWLTVICAGLLLSSLRAQERDHPLLLIPNAAEITASPEAAERFLNDQTRRGYRLVSVRDLQLWVYVGDALAPEYRIVTEPVVQFETNSHVRDANSRFADRLNELAREGFCVHQRAILKFGSGMWGTERGAAVMERPPERPLTCRYDVVHASDTTESGVVLRHGSVPLALPFRGILTESFDSTNTTPTEGQTLRRVKVPFRLFATVEENDQRLAEGLARSADEGCRLLGEWPASRYHVVCDPSAPAKPAEYRLVHLPEEERGMWKEPKSPGDLSTAQALLSAASADGYCLAGGALPSGAPLLLEKETPAAFRCEYRLVVAEGQRLIDMVKRGLSQGFEPTWRASIPWGALLERRRPADAGTIGDGAAQ